MARDRVHNILINILTRVEGGPVSLRPLKDEMKDLRREADADIASFRDLRASIRETQKVSKDGIKLDVDRSAIDRSLEAVRDMREEIDKLTRRRFINVPSPDLRGRAEARRDELDAIEQELNEFRQATQERATLARRAEDLIDQHREAIAQKDRSRQFKLAHELAAVRERLSLADSEIDRRRASDLDLVARAMRSLGGGAKEMDRTASSTRGLLGHVDGLTGRLKGLFPVLRGVAILLVAALIPAILALVGSLVSAVSAVIGLASAFTAALGPALGVLIAAFSRIGAVMSAFQQREQALDADRKRAINTAQIQAAQEERIRNARNGVRDATQALTEAEEEYADATRDLKEAARDAYQEIEQAALDAKEAVLDLADAQLSLEESQLGIKEAKLALREFREEIGATGPELDALFRKVVESGADPAALAALTAGLRASGGLTPEQAVTLEQLTLRLERAKLNEKQATLDLTQAERDRGEAQREAARLAREGITATDSYSAALERQESASDSVRDAEERLTEARLDLRRAHEQETDALVGQLSAMDDYRREREKLTAVERNFLDAIIKTKKGLRDLITAGTDPVLAALTAIFQNLQRFGGFARAAFQTIGRSLGKAFIDITREMTSPAWATFWLTAITGAQSLVDVLASGVFVQFLRIWRNLATAFMPLAIEAMKRFAGWLGTIAGRTQGLTSTSKSVQVMAESFFAIMGLLGDIVEMLVAFGAAVAPAGNELIGWLRDGIKRFTEWLRTAEGQKRVQKFFKSTLPFVKELVKFVVNLGKAFLVLMELAAPFLTVMFKGINAVLEGFIEMAEFLNELMPDWLKELIVTAGALAAAFTKGFGQIAVGFGKITIPLKILIAGLALLGGALDPLVDAFWAAVHAVEDAINWLLDFLGISSPSKLFIQIGKALAQGLVAGIKGLPGLVLRAGKWLIERVWDGLWSLAPWLFGQAKKIPQWIMGGIVALAHFIWETGKWIVESLWAGIKALGRFLAQIGEWVIGKIAQGITAAWDTLKTAAEAIYEALKDIFKAGIKVAVHLFKGDDGGVFGALKAIPGVGGLVGGAEKLWNELASGGVAQGPTFALIGEGVNKEVVLPLSKRVFAELGAGIAAAVPRVPALAGNLGSVGAAQPRHVHYHIQSPPGTVPDAKYAVSQIELELRRRGGSN